VFEAFEDAFKADPVPPRSRRVSSLPSDPADWTAFIDQFGGQSFENGLYRVIRGEDRETWLARVASVFPAYADRIICFGFDWLGRVFAIDYGEPRESDILLFEPGTTMALEIPMSLAEFHNVELVEDPDPALASEFYARWIDSGGSAPAYSECVGYKIPLFLNGEDDTPNLEVSDIDVYWHVISELVDKIKAAAE